MSRSPISRVLCAGFILLLFCVKLPAQSLFPKQPAAGVLYQYPKAGSVEVNPVTEIGIRSERQFDPHVLESLRAVVIGSLSGEHKITPRLTRDRTMIILHPNIPFEYNENISVDFSAGLEFGGSVLDNFSFATMVESIPHWEGGDAEAVPPSLKAKTAPLQTEEDAVSNMQVTKDVGAVPGTITFDNYGGVGATPVPVQLIEMDEHGSVIRHQPVLKGRPLLFEKFGHNYAYWSPIPGTFYVLDSANWKVIDTLSAANGDSTDGHELLLFADGSYALLGVTIITQDLSSRGGSKKAHVGWSTIQVFDRDKNLMFDWKGSDYFLPSDIEKHVPFNVTAVDAQHSNSLDFDAEGNIILSSRHLCEITKINGKTGAVMWRFGGAKSSFALRGDTVWFSYQHYAHWLPNGHLLFFDNSNVDTVAGRTYLDTVRSSRAVEYVIDTVAKTATLFWQFSHTPPVFSFAMGAAERLLPSGNTMISWGAPISATPPAITEVTPQDSVVFELILKVADYNYRSEKHPTSGEGITGGAFYSGAGTKGVASPVSSSNGVSLNILDGAGSNSVIVNYSVSSPGNVSINLFDALGRNVQRIFDGVRTDPGQHSTGLDLTKLPSGIYYCVLRTDSATVTAMFEHVR